MENIGLVLEGGALRGVYTSGILDFFMEKDIYFPYIIGVSAGALNALSYISRQKGRSIDVVTNYVNNKNLISKKNLFTNKDVFKLDYYFNKLCKETNPFDFNTFDNAREKLVIVCTDCNSGKPIYYYKNECEDIYKAVKASSTLPIMNREVKIGDKTLLDGGLADSIPVKKSISDGNKKNVLVLTNDCNHKKKPFRWLRILKRKYKNHNELIELIRDKHNRYNKCIEYLKSLEEDKDVFIFRPSRKIKLGHYDKNIKKIRELYNLGYEDGKNNYNQLLDWLKN